MNTCATCKRALDVFSDPLSLDCGGDCLLCMAMAGDPTCVTAVLQQAVVPQDDLPEYLFTNDEHECQFTLEPGTPPEECWHYLRRCRLCRKTWYSTHCRCEQPLRTCGCQ